MYKLRTKRSVELLLQVFCFVRTPQGVALRRKEVEAVSPNVKNTMWIPHGDIKFETVGPGESPEGAYTKLFRYMVESFNVTRTQHAGYMLEALDGATYYDFKILQSMMANIRGANMLDVKMEPTSVWKPEFNAQTVQPRHIRDFMLLAMLDEPLIMLMSAGIPQWRNEMRALIRMGSHSELVDHMPKFCVPPLAFLAGRVILKEKPLLNPFYVAHNSFLSGGTPEGLADVLGKMARDTVTINESPRRLVTAVVRWMKKNKSYIKTDPPLMNAETARNTKIESSTKAGINLHAPQEVENLEKIVLKYVNKSLTKREDGPATRILGIKVLEKIAAKIREHPNLRYDPSMFDPIRVVNQVSIKVESRMPGADPLKTRVIFVVSAIKTYLDRIAFNPFLKRCYGQGANKIGHKWKNGGASRIAGIFRALEYDPANPSTWHVYVPFDIGKFDQSAAASFLLMVLFYPYLVTRKGGENHKIWMQILIWSTENAVQKVVKWLGPDWKIVLGQIVSGDYRTSESGSHYLEGVVDCYDMFLFEEKCVDISDGLRGEYPFPPESYDWPREKFVGAARETFKKCFRSFIDYGDDGLLAYSEWVKDMLGEGQFPTGLQFYMKTRWHMDLKVSDSKMHCDSDERPDRNLSSLFTQLGNTMFDDVIYDGPKFLKRKIIMYDFGNGPEPAPWRPTADYYGKSTCVANNNVSIAMHLIRLRALAMDTYGTNPQAYRFLYRAHEYLKKSCPLHEIEKEMNEIFVRMQSIDDDLSDVDAEDKDLFARMGGHSGLALIMQGFPLARDIREGVRYDCTVQEAIDQHQHDKLFMSPEQLIGVQ